MEDKKRKNISIRLTQQEIRDLEDLCWVFSLDYGRRMYGKAIKELIKRASRKYRRLITKRHVTFKLYEKGRLDPENDFYLRYEKIREALEVLRTNEEETTDE